MRKDLTNTEKLAYEYFIKVISSAVNDNPAPAPYEGINWGMMLKIAGISSLESMFATTVYSLKDKLNFPDALCARLKQISAQQTLFDGVLNYEVERLLRTFDKYKIKNAPLKGYFMKSEYPRPDFRSVADFDILFDINQLDDLKKAFAELGYEFVQNDDSQYHFKKPPYVYIEMHYTLVHNTDPNQKYLLDQLDKCIKRDNYDYSYQMTPEDYYIFMLVHHAKHYREGGMGIKMLLDVYIYYQHHSKDFDMDYLNARLKLLNLQGFDSVIRKIAFNWFSSSEPKITFDDIESYILLSATFGRIDTAVMINSYKSIKKSQKQGKSSSKLSYLLSSIFPPKESYQYSYPYVQKYPFLIPIAWFSMWFKRFFINKNVHVKRGIENRISYSDEDVSFVSKLFDEVGFEDFK
jgi:hypothetical protein